MKQRRDERVEKKERQDEDEAGEGAETAAGMGSTHSRACMMDGTSARVVGR